MFVNIEALFLITGDAYGEQRIGNLAVKANSRVFVDIAKANTDVRLFCAPSGNNVLIFFVAARNVPRPPSH